MYIRRTSTSSQQSKGSYYTYRLVETERINGKVKQRTVLNLGRHFGVAREDWKPLVNRINQIITSQSNLLTIE
jgi:hypothetical protein